MKKSVAVVGAGPAGLMAADVLAAGGAAVTVYERMPSVGRKFLLAGRGGLNLTTAKISPWLSRYGAAVHLGGYRALSAGCAAPSANPWTADVRRHQRSGVSAALRRRRCCAWLRSLDARGVFRLRHDWRGWKGCGGVGFSGPTGTTEVKADAGGLALGGASWPRVGSDGAWVGTLREQGIAIAPLKPANAGFEVAWSERFRSEFAGHPLKNIALKFEGSVVRGEAVVTRDGLEGGGVYALSAPLREATSRDGAALLRMALKPDLDSAALTARLEQPRGKQSMSTFCARRWAAAGLDCTPQWWRSPPKRAIGDVERHWPNSSITCRFG